MSFESLDYHRGIGNKFTHMYNWTQILLILCKRPNKVYLIKMLKHQAQTGFGTIIGFCVFCLLTSTQDLWREAYCLRDKCGLMGIGRSVGYHSEWANGEQSIQRVLANQLTLMPEMLSVYVHFFVFYNFVK